MQRAILVFLLLCSVHAFGAWTITNDKQAFNSSVTFANALTSGSIIVAVCRSAINNGTPDDTAGTSFTFITSVNTNIGGGNEPFVRLFLAYNTNTTASDVLKCTDGLGSTYSIEAFEITGGPVGAYYVDAVASLGSQVSAGGGANAIVLTSQTTTINGDFVYAAWLPNGGSSFTAGTSPVAFTTMPGAQNAVLSEEAIQSTHGSIGPTFGYVGGAVNWGGLWVALSPTLPVTIRHQAIVTTSR